MSIRTAIASLTVLWFAASAAAPKADDGGKPDQPPPSVRIDAERKGEPISKYIYGQFIEHLGRCIYGGIWAEMLEDRKFYFPITPTYDPYEPQKNDSPDTEFPIVSRSPWQVIGAEDSVHMIREAPFVGEHTPLISANTAIQQNDLAIVKGRDYVGYVWLKAAGPAVAAKATLRGAEGQADFANVSQQYAKHSFRFTARESLPRSSLTIAIAGGPCFVGAVSLMPADNVAGMRADTLALLKELNSPIYRWPGGNFVSGYDWKDGVGDRDRRPPRKNPAWTGIEHNDFGVDELMAFCRIVGAEPYIAVNSGLGRVDSAVELVQYMNGAPNTPMGARRAENGHPAPYGVKWWGVGNEMYGRWQLGHMPLEEYVKKHNQFAEAMRAADPSIRLVAVGQVGPWSEGMMRHCADHMDLISEHFYLRDQPELAAHVQQMPKAVRDKAIAHRDYRRRFDSLKGQDIDIAMDEWNYWYGLHAYGQLGVRYFLKDALGVAAGIHEFTRQSDIVFMANYAQTVNVIGCIKTNRTDACFDATGLALKLYRNHYGVVPLQAAAQPPLDVAAALSEDGKTLTVAIVNPTMTALKLPLTVSGATLAGAGKCWRIAAADPQAHNTPGQPPQVRIEESPLASSLDPLPVAACSVALFAFNLK